MNVSLVIPTQSEWEQLVWRLVVVGGDSSYSGAVPIRLAGTRAVRAQWW